VNVCGQPWSLQIRGNVSQFGQRSPASSSRYSRTVSPSRHAACPTDQPAVDPARASWGASPSEDRRASGTK